MATQQIALEDSEPGLLREIRPLLNKVDAISFDVFDTLFLRPFVDAEHLFDLVGTRHGIKGFRSIRQQAQRDAFRVMHEEGRHEIDIEGIYACMPEGLPVPARTLMQTEIALELDATRPNEEMISVFKQLVDEGHKVILTSDMYLKKGFFEELLERHELPDVPMFISAECNATKRDHGALFDHLASALETHPSRILHIGDHPVGDIQMARSKGLQTFHYVETHLPPRVKDIGAAESIARGLSRFRRQLSQDRFFTLGYEYGGPGALGFLQWIETQAKLDDISHLLFVSRDGYVLDLMLDAHRDQFDMPPTSYFKGSRVAFNLAAMDEHNFDSFVPFLLSGSDGLSVDEIFTRIGVPSPATKVLHDLGFDDRYVLSLGNQDRVRDLIEAMKPEILKVCRENRRGLFRYLHELSIRDGDRVGFVDVGWNGSTQEGFEKAIADMFDVQVQGYYFCLSALPECAERRRRLAMKALVDASSFPEAEVMQIYNNRVIAEFFFSAPHDPIIGYRNDLSCVSFVEDAGRSIEPTEFRSRVASANDGMLAFAEDYLAWKGTFSMEADPKGTAMPLIAFVRETSANAHPEFADMKGFDAWGSSRNLSL